MNETNNEFNNEVPNSNGNTVKVALIVLLVVALIGCISFVAYDKIFGNDNDTNVGGSDTNSFKSYSIGDKVTLTDSSSWSVLESSSENSEYVTLLRNDNMNEDFTITFKDASNYLSTTYKSNLITNLKVTSDKIIEVRLLTLDDISKLSGISVSDLVPGTSLENDITPSFLYQSATITSAMGEFDSPIMVCEAVPKYYETNPGRICVSTGTDTEPIRPVITISKEYIK